MTISDTMNTMSTVEEAIRLIEAGCELVRITAPSKKEAENLKKAGFAKGGSLDNAIVVQDSKIL